MDEIYKGIVCKPIKQNKWVMIICHDDGYKHIDMPIEKDFTIEPSSPLVIKVSFIYKENKISFELAKELDFNDIQFEIEPVAIMSTKFECYFSEHEIDIDDNLGLWEVVYGFFKQKNI